MDDIIFSLSYDWILIAPGPEHHCRERAAGGLADVLLVELLALILQVYSKHLGLIDRGDSIIPSLLY
jgi:hypothetical protein